ncbi:MAG: hypothetical protein ABIN13_09735, partial [Mucilaginibacter sp.]
MKKIILLAAVICAITAICSFKSSMNEQDWLLWTNKCLMQSYNPVPDTKLKKFEFTVTGDSFIRLRKTYAK